MVDEFHRLPDRFLDLLRLLWNQELILITSTRWLAKRKLLGTGSPLLRIVQPIRIDPIDEREILAEMSREVRERS